MTAMCATGTLMVGDPWPSYVCSTGCPTCGCTNANCGYNRGEQRVLFNVATERSPLQDEIEGLKAAAKRGERPWVSMKRAPRRYRK